MDLMEQVRAKAAANPQKVAFFEADDAKIMQTVGELTRDGLAECYLVGDAAVLAQVADENGVSLESVHVVDVTDEEANEAFAQRFEAVPDCPFKPKAIRRRAKRPMDRALMMERIDDVDITFGGISCSTGDVIIGGQTIVGLADGIDTISSCGIFNIPGWEGSEGHLLGFGDAAVCVDPDPEQLASIAISAAETVQALMGWEPRVAMLSYSTDGSAESPMVDKVRAAVKVAQERSSSSTPPSCPPLPPRRFVARARWPARPTLSSAPTSTWATLASSSCRTLPMPTPMVPSCRALRRSCATAAAPRRYRSSSATS